jgi:hypothetical protein
MGKMHQLLAVEKDITGRAGAAIAEAIQTFKTKATEFYTANVKTYKPLDDADRDLLPKEEKPYVDTVVDKLKFLAGALATEYDFLFQKESTNAKATADLILEDGTVLATKVPATFLLTLEHRLEKLRGVIAEAPTLPTGFFWEKDTQSGPYVYKLKDALITYRTKKVPYAFELAPATKDHKAQVVEKENTITVGAYTEMKRDTRVTSSQKSEWLGKVDAVLVATRKAIRTANDIDHSEAKIGGTILDYILS